MKAIVVHQYGGPEVLKFEDYPDPVPGPGQVLVQVAATSVNPVDYKIRAGGYPAVKQDKLPFVLGRDVAGDRQERGRIGDRRRERDRHVRRSWTR